MCPSATARAHRTSKSAPLNWQECEPILEGKSDVIHMASSENGSPVEEARNLVRPSKLGQVRAKPGMSQRGGEMSKPCHVDWDLAKFKVSDH